ncbi:hypothetical protein PVAND_009862 [Polypedilum vanderplanki]|uniref:Uncharacterized protein n=1 Tax=Polypedilum vanderplanki TaxID=319348 RepID=A0A9J6CEW4_POLVA|nr:hypothetical protein PVAND_009862 [Polypedilum vanderplanki]
MILTRNSKNLSSQSSQLCEKIFRSARSITGVYSTITNWPMMLFISRLHKIEYSSVIEKDLRNLLTFDKLEKPNDSFDEQEIIEEEIVVTIHNAMIEATERARALGMEVEGVNLNRLVHVIDDSTSEKKQK